MAELNTYRYPTPIQARYRCLSPECKVVDLRHLYLSLALQTGVCIIDSPGFGEDPTKNSALMDYIANNEIFAFIYVLKSDNAGGVQEDRV